MAPFRQYRHGRQGEEGFSSIADVVYFVFLSLYVWGLMVFGFGWLGYLMFVLYAVLVILLARRISRRDAEKPCGTQKDSYNKMDYYC